MKNSKWVIAAAMTIAMATAAELRAELPVKNVLTLEMARAVTVAARDEALKRGATVVIAVVDDGGHVVSLERLNDTQVASVDVGIGKARTCSSETASSTRAFCKKSRRWPWSKWAFTSGASRAMSSGPSDLSAAGERSAASTSCLPPRKSVSNVCNSSTSVARLPAKNCKSSIIKSSTSRYLRRKLGSPLPCSASKK